MKTPSYLTLCILLSLTQLTKAEILLNDETFGLCYSPYTVGQPPDYVTEEKLLEQLFLIKNNLNVSWIRSYGSANGLEKIPEIAKAAGFDKVAMGVWIRHNDNTEIDNMLNAAKQGYVDLIVLGNEEIYAGEAVNTLIEKIKNVKQRLLQEGCEQIPVAIAEPFEALFFLNANYKVTNLYPDLLSEIDVVLVNIYPFWLGRHIDNAIQDLELYYTAANSAVKAIDPNISVFIGETGWPSSGAINEDAEPSLTNAARYYNEVTQWSQNKGILTFYFEAFSEPWKAPPEIEANWGIFDSNEEIKPRFIKEPYMLETFDPQVNSFSVRTHWTNSGPEPSIQSSETDSDGNYLRIAYDGYRNHYGSVAFDRAAIGPYSRIVSEFDFRISGTSASADGFALMHIPTIVNDNTGISNYNTDSFFAEEPKLLKTFAMGFDVWNGHGDADKLSISWNNQWWPENNDRYDLPFDIDDGIWHHVVIDLCYIGNGKAHVYVTLTKNIYESPHNDETYIIAQEAVIGDSNNYFEPYESRVEFVARNGGLDCNVDLDNIFIMYFVE